MSSTAPGRADVEVALLVEDAVVRHVDLSVDGVQRAAGQHRGHVVDALGALGGKLTIATTPWNRQVMPGFDRLYGLELLSASDEEVRAQVRVGPGLKRPAGLVHGGVYASMVESMASLATALAVVGNGHMAM